MNNEDVKNWRYRVYYSDRYQNFNMTPIHKHDEYGDQWFLVFDAMKNRDFHLFKCFLYSAGKKKYSKAYVKNKALEFDDFVKRLDNYKLTIEDNING
jgi:hypothetical protein